MAGWRRYSEKWYIGYAFQGAVVLGVAPILLPLVVGNALGDAEAGAVVACFYVGQLMAPLLGTLTDKARAYKLVYFLGYGLLALGLALFPELTSLGFWFALAFLQGMGSAATNTVAAMFIVEFKPKEEWDPRIGWLQTFYGAGQAVGLGLAALLQAVPQVGLLISAALMLPGVWFGRQGLPATKAARHRPKPHLHQHMRRSKAPHRALGWMIHHYQASLTKNLIALVRHACTPYGVYIASWFCTMFGTWLMYNLYPLLMRSAYGIDAGLSSLYYALAALIGVFAYAPSGTLGEKIGDVGVVLIGTLMTLASVASMAVLAFIQPANTAWLAPVAFLLLPVAWSPLIVAGTSGAAQLSTLEEGTAVGIFNATTAIGSVLSALTAGLLAEYLGYAWVCMAAAASALLGAALLIPLLGKAKKQATR
ncbi:MFS transporter [Desulfohalovibrio reitneri]|uniref:MFS transporter n=1 Tax=Desulfohalovibrio reitneri TaxID=1307759 RepID=UPI0004A73BD2|nr:MFS transporter [Desulfohalovibrio reitneri]